ncbi:MAG: hypothetical protein HYV63_12450 [Candidatus Schekmanbacteria bacterium]|nr:hypothetical protein [Candidatus Schekmanbacteria bacterium]
MKSQDDEQLFFSYFDGELAAPEENAAAARARADSRAAAILEDLELLRALSAGAAPANTPRSEWEARWLGIESAIGAAVASDRAAEAPYLALALEGFDELMGELRVPPSGAAAARLVVERLLMAGVSPLQSQWLGAVAMAGAGVARLRSLLDHHRAAGKSGADLVAVLLRDGTCRTVVKELRASAVEAVRAELDIALANLGAEGSVAEGARSLFAAMVRADVPALTAFALVLFSVRTGATDTIGAAVAGAVRIGKRGLDLVQACGADPRVARLIPDLT